MWQLQGNTAAGANYIAVWKNCRKEVEGVGEDRHKPIWFKAGKLTADAIFILR